VSELAEANHLSNPNVIRVGEVLRVPSEDGGNPILHVVKYGETLSQIARSYGRTTVDLAAANGIVNPDRIYSGMQLQVDGASPPSVSASTAPATGSSASVVVGNTTTYTVVFGDTLSTIAQQFDTTGTQLVRLNDLADPNFLTAGQTLRVPGNAFTCPLAKSWYSNDWHTPRVGGRLHLGTDLFAAEGTSVVAPVSGTAEQIDGTRGGLQFWLYGDDGNLYIGTHLSAYGSAGEVNAGDTLGRVGRTGNAKSTPPHLHFEIMIDGVEVNPYLTLQANGC
jgi:LysM repeat protein